MGKTVAQLGWLIQRLVENGVVRSDTKLEADDYIDLVFSARDYLLFQRKVTGIELTNSAVMSSPIDYKIEHNKITLEKGFNIQGVRQVALVDNSGHQMSNLVTPLSQDASVLVSNSIFCHCFLNVDYIGFQNLPKEAKKARLFNIAGSSPNDPVSEDFAFMIIQQVMKLGQMSEASKADTSADGNNQEDGFKNQVRQLINQPDNIV